jgi:hypothetical protein
MARGPDPHRVARCGRLRVLNQRLTWLGAMTMRRAYLWAIPALSWLVPPSDAEDFGSVPSAPAARGGVEPARRPPQAVMCGPNALYIFLKAHARPVSADRLFREVDPGDQGLSLGELRDASTRYGLSSEVRRCTYEQLVGECPLPLVALLRPGPEIGGRGPGHYVLVVHADSDAITLIDATSGRQISSPRAAFCRDWKGYVVVPTGGRPSWLPLLAGTGAAWALVGWLTLRLKSPGTCASRLTQSEVSSDASSM